MFTALGTIYPCPSLFVPILNVCVLLIDILLIFCRVFFRFKGNMVEHVFYVCVPLPVALSDIVLLETPMLSDRANHVHAILVSITITTLRPVQIS